MGAKSMFKGTPQWKPSGYSQLNAEGRGRVKEQKKRLQERAEAQRRFERAEEKREAEAVERKKRKLEVVRKRETDTSSRGRPPHDSFARPID